MIARDEKVRPGPGNYALISATSRTGTYFLSRFRSSACRRFGSELRSTLALFPVSPGPGTYRLPSEFGHYESQEKYVAETARTDRLRGMRLSVGASRGKKDGSPNKEGMRTSSTIFSRSASQPNIGTQAGEVTKVQRRPAAGK